MRRETAVRLMITTIVIAVVVIICAKTIPVINEWFTTLRNQVFDAFNSPVNSPADMLFEAETLL